MQALTALAVLACPVGMGAMMWLMMRRPAAPPGEPGQEVARLRAELDQLQGDASRDRHPSGPTSSSDQ